MAMSRFKHFHRRELKKRVTLHGTILLLFRAHRQDQQNGVKSSGLSSLNCATAFIPDIILPSGNGSLALGTPEKPFARHRRGKQNLFLSVVMRGFLLDSRTKRGRCCGRVGFDCEGKDGRAGV